MFELYRAGRKKREYRIPSKLYNQERCHAGRGAVIAYRYHGGPQIEAMIKRVSLRTYSTMKKKLSDTYPDIKPDDKVLVIYLELNG